MAIPTSELQKINPSAIIELFELQLIASIHGSDQLFRYHSGSNQNGNGEIVWQGNSYTRFPVEAEGFEFTGKGQIPRPTLTVSNVLSTLTTLIASVNAFTPANDLNGAKLTRIRTTADNLDAINFSGGSNPFGTPSSNKFPDEVFFLDRKVLENREVVQYELVSALDLANVRVPKRQITRKDFDGVGTFIDA
tara:strand:- start:1517 stop:2092 length:576 start_codon:yes stop_codon:yes gene_type:complete